MNAINTASSGPPTTVLPTPPAPQQGATPAAKLATPPFKALLAALGATGVVQADAGTIGSDVATSGVFGSIAALPHPNTPDVAPAGTQRRRHDDSANIPIFAFGVPVTIAAIPVATLTVGSVARSQSQAVSGTAVLSPTATNLAAVDSFATAVLPGAHANSGDGVISAASLAASIKSGDMSLTPSSAPASVAIPLTAPSQPTTSSNSILPVAAKGQRGQAPLAQTVQSDTVLAATGAAPAPTMAATAPAAGGVVGLMATVSAAVATDAGTPTVAPLKSAHHGVAASMSADAWSAQAGTVLGSDNAVSATPPPPAHPAVTGAAQQMVAQATLLHNGQSAEMQLRLRPPDLGDVRVILRRDATGALSAHLIPATREAADALNANLHHLRTALDQHSQGHRADVSVGQRDVADQRQQHMNGGHSSHEDETSAAHPATPTANGDQSAAPRVGRAVAATATVDYDA